MKDPWCKEDPRQALVWLRPDPRSRLIPAWMLGVCLLIAGSLMCALFFTHTVPALDVYLLVLGLFSILCGMLTMVINALKVLQDETCLVILPIGILYKNFLGKEYQMTWQTIENITTTEIQNQIEIYYQEKYCYVSTQWMGIEAEHLCILLLSEQRRVLMGIPLESDRLFRDLKVNIARPIL